MAWHVAVADQDGCWSDWSEALTWDMGILRTLPISSSSSQPRSNVFTWQGQWLARSNVVPPTDDCAYYADRPNPLFRTEFSLSASNSLLRNPSEIPGTGDSKPIARARLLVGALGYYEVFIDGMRVVNRMLDPKWTSVDKRIAYVPTTSPR